MFYTISVYHGSFYGWVSTKVMYATRAKAMREATKILKIDNFKRVAVIGHHPCGDGNVEVYKRIKNNNTVMKWEKVL